MNKRQEEAKLVVNMNRHLYREAKKKHELLITARGYWGKSYQSGWSGEPFDKSKHTLELWYAGKKNKETSK